MRCDEFDWESAMYHQQQAASWGLSFGTPGMWLYFLNRTGPQDRPL